ncbi:hypothetical protein BJY04DRAFT_230746 [Aspergillus karnatakaensis]|uniref:putative 3-hydroxyacyl-CoA dehydrogenase n=1 Tax=Aspergillus karnatakaensis TaxID=1810916 RepID=UPI003CCE290C
MSQYTKDLIPGSLKDKVIVLTGGANGIGAAFVEHAISHGAFVCFGDLATEAGEALAKKVAGNSSPPRAVFVRTDVTSYDSVLALFDKALETYGRIDHAIAGAGITELGNVFDPALDMQSIRQPPTTKVLDVNLLGCIYVSRIASVYLRQNPPSTSTPDRSILLIASVAAFKESPGLFIYQAAKHGVLGLMRSLRLYSPTAHGIRVNCICPWMTKTAMVKGVQDSWFEAGLPVNEPIDVAKVMGRVIGDGELNGTSMYVEGGRAWEIEANIDRLERQWLGDEPSRSLEKGQAVLGSGMGWTSK